MNEQRIDPDANGHRTEKDTMGEVRVPAEALWGASTQRAVEIFPISGLRFPRPFIRVLGMLKGIAAEVNRDLGLLDAELAELIAAAADEVARGEHDDHFPVDIFQTGSGTNTNMNANEVIANLANRKAGSDLGAKQPVHPNDHVNMGQSSNDVIPTTIHVAALDGIVNALAPALENLQRSLAAKAEEFAEVVKPGRTHLMDATPVTLGQEFAGYARQVELGVDRLDGPADRLAEVALGGTAVGTGLNADPRFAPLVIERLGDRAELPLHEAADHFEAQGAQDAVVEMSGALKTVAVSVAKIANDLRWMNSGPRAGLAEIRLPELVPGSSIMPGKVNPVIPEAVYQVAAHVIGNDAAITFGGATGSFELNTMLPVMTHNLLEQIAFLAQAVRILDEDCVRGIAADPDRCRELVEATFSIVTALAPAVGYDEAAAISKEALRSGRSVREVAAERGALSPDELDRVLDVRRMADGGTP